jgi:hypothetical protein
MPKAEKAKEQKGKKQKVTVPCALVDLVTQLSPALALVGHTSDMTAGQGSLR